MKFEEADLRGYFTLKELRATGADLGKISPWLMLALVKFREIIKMPVILLPGGLTSGDHEPGSYHYRGEAVDFMLGRVPPSLDFVVESMLRAEFRGIGVYHNGAVYSFHGDIRGKFEFWSGTKRQGEKKWKYGLMIRVP